MPETTSKRQGEERTDSAPANEPRADTQPEPDRDVENYRDEYDLPRADRPKAASDHCP